MGRAVAFLWLNAFCFGCVPGMWDKVGCPCKCKQSAVVFSESAGLTASTELPFELRSRWTADWESKMTYRCAEGLCRVSVAHRPDHCNAR
jgi:hypothetical protein